MSSNFRVLSINQCLLMTALICNLSLAQAFVPGELRSRATLENASVVQLGPFSDRQVTDGSGPLRQIKSTDTLHSYTEYFPERLLGGGTINTSVSYGYISGSGSWTDSIQNGNNGLSGAIFSHIGEYTIPDITIVSTGNSSASSIPISIHYTAHWKQFAGSDPLLTLVSRLDNTQRLTQTYLSSTNALSEFEGSERFSFDFNAPVDQPFRLKTLVNLTTATRMAINNTAQGAYSWSIGLGGSPAFILPEGYVANSSDGSIVNNYFVGPPPSHVPVPASALLFISGLIGLFSFNRKSAK